MARTAGNTASANNDLADALNNLGGDGFEIVEPGEHAPEPASPDTRNGNGGTTGSGTGPIDPASLTGDGSAPKRGRGRPRGSRNAGSAGTGSSTRQSASEATATLNAMLFSFHSIAATMLKTPELMISEDESKKLAKAVNHVTELYDVKIMDEKTAAWLALGGTMVQVYGTRVVSVMAKAKTRGPAKGRVTVMPPHGAPVDFTSAGVAHG